MSIDLIAEMHSTRKNLETLVYGEIISNFTYSNDKNEDYQIILSKKRDDYFIFLKKYKADSAEVELVKTEYFSSMTDLIKKEEKIKKEMGLMLTSL